jgi:chromosome segregation ATPase
LGQDLKNEISVREQEKKALLHQVGELQVKADQTDILQVQMDSFSSDKSRMEEEIMTLKSELAEVSMQAAQLRGENERLGMVHSTHVTEIEQLRLALQSADNDSVHQAEVWKEKATGLTKEHVNAMDLRNKLVSEEMTKLTEQWQSDVAARDMRFQEMKTAESDLQKMVLTPV